MNQKQILTYTGLAAVVIASGAMWWWIVARQTKETLAADATMSTAIDLREPPVLQAEPPKLAGKILVGPQVQTKFYLAKNGKRYVFPDETKTFETWFPKNAPIVKVTASELESYPLGGNAWYRPGTRMIRITTDTRVFAVAHHGVLRPITETTAEQIFGKSWKSLVDTLQDYYFTNYTIGAQIASPNDYSIAAEQARSKTIEDDLEL